MPNVVGTYVPHAHASWCLSDCKKSFVSSSFLFWERVKVDGPRKEKGEDAWNGTGFALEWLSRLCRKNSIRGPEMERKPLHPKIRKGKPSLLRALKMLVFAADFLLLYSISAHPSTVSQKNWRNRKEHIRGEKIRAMWSTVVIPFSSLVTHLPTRCHSCFRQQGELGEGETAFSATYFSRSHRSATRGDTFPST